METRNTNTVISYGFRTAVGVHFVCLCVLTFGMSKTLIGFSHHAVALVLTTLMAIIGVLFVGDMATRKDERREHSKLVDVVVGCVWLAIVGFLVMNSLRAGMW
jgi:ABC-type Na+ efflux pump permease subunit